ncbi:MAG: P-loop containing nucleoside triphosphate hydrolase protein [Benniella sp.]|nr:MAG: P-loop containing nucleoside triphosphate hydrolase protein [Benniella sp.]
MATVPNPDSIGAKYQLEDVVDNFEGMNLNPELLRGIHACGFERPLALQQNAIPPILEKQDVIVQSLPGGGKTTTFSISVLQGIDTSIMLCQALILAPTRERAPQIQKVVMALGDFMKIRCHVCIGGTNVREDMGHLREWPQIVVGTSGRVLHMIKCRALKTDSIKMFIIDEANEILSTSKDQLHKDVFEIFQSIPRGTQVIFSLTRAHKGLEGLAQEFMRSPVFIAHVSGKSKKPKSKQEETVYYLDSMKLKSELRHGIRAYCFKRPVLLFQHAIMSILKSHDVIIQAPSGTDTIAAFSIPILQKLNSSNALCQALVLVPTYEMAQPIQEVVVALGRYMNILFQDLRDKINTRSTTPRINEARIAVKTPRSVLNKIESGSLETSSIMMLVIYEVDEMISNRLSDSIHDVFQRLPPGTQVVLLSTKTPKETSEILPMENTKMTAKFKREPIRIVIENDGVTGGLQENLRDRGCVKGAIQAGYAVSPLRNDCLSPDRPLQLHQLSNESVVSKKRLSPAIAAGDLRREGHVEGSTLEHSKQFYVLVVKEEQKLDRLRALYETLMITQAVIFCNTRKKVDWLAKKLVVRKLTVSAVHDDTEETQLETIMEEFRSGSTHILITTDLLIHGSDVLPASLIINYDLPVTKESYIHRVPPGGREGRKGVILNFITVKDKPMLGSIEKFYSIQITEMPKNLAEHI